MPKVSENVINNVATVTDEASSKLNAIGAAGEAMGKKMAEAAAGATAQLNDLDRAADRAARKASPGAVLAARARMLGQEGQKLAIEVKRVAAAGGDLSKLEAKIIAIENEWKRVASAAKAAAEAQKSAASQGPKASGGIAGDVAKGSFLGSFAANAADDFINNIESGFRNAAQAARDFVDSVRDLGEATRETMNESTQTGLSPRTLQAFGYAAKAAGIDVGTLRNGMELLAQSVVEHPEKFEAIGVKVRNLKGDFLPLEEVIGSLSDVIGGVTDKTARLYLVQELVGQRIGGRILPIMEQGREGLKRFADEGERLGVVLDGAAQESLVNYANAAARADLAWEGVSNRLRIALIPYLTIGAAGLEKLAAFTLFSADAARHWVRDNVPFAKTAMDVATAVGALNHALRDKNGSTASVGDDVTKKMLEQFKNASEIAEKAKSVESIVQSINDARVGDDAVKVMALGLMGAADNQKLLNERVAALVNKWGPGVAQRAATMAVELSGLGGAAKKAAQEQEQLNAKLKTFSERISESMTGENAEAVANTVDIMQSMGHAGESAAEITAFAFKRLRGDVELVGRAVDELAKREDALRNVDLTGSRSIATDIERAMDALAKAEAEQKKRDDEFAHRRSKGGFLETMNQSLEDAANKWLVLGDASESVISRMSGGADNFFNKFLEKTFQSKDVFTQAFLIMSQEAIRALNKIIMSKLFLFLVNILGKVGGGATQTVDSPIGPDPVPQLGLVSGAPSASAAVVNNNFTIQTFSPRDVIREFTSPNGSMRSARATLSYMAER